MKSTNVFLGVLAGAAIGAIAGVLFAPHKGSKTRKLIISKGEDYLEDFKEKVSDIAEVISQKYNGISEDAKNIIAQGSVKNEVITNDIKQSIS